MKKRKVWLTKDQVDQMFKLAESNERDWLLLQLLRWSLRVGEVVGVTKDWSCQIWKDPENRDLGKKTVTGRTELPGIHWSHIRDSGIQIIGKGWLHGSLHSQPTSGERFVAMPKDLIERLRFYAIDKSPHPEVYTMEEAANLDWKVFHIRERQAHDLVKKYARLAHLEDCEKIGPHRLRAFFATDAKDRGIDAFMIRDLMRHANITTTQMYVGVATPERLSKVVELLATDSD